MDCSLALPESQIVLESRQLLTDTVPVDNRAPTLTTR